MGGDLKWFRAPGRVNLMGDHTDYSEGFVLPMAIDRECIISCRPREDGRVRVRSAQIEGVVDLGAAGEDDPSGIEPAWGRYVGGVVRTLAERGRPPTGMEAAISSTVPLRSGLASSAALEVAVAMALCDVAGFGLPARDLALACREAEEIATGVPCGAMDQMVAIFGRRGHAVLIDCRTNDLTYIPMPEELAVVAIHSGTSRSLEDTEYAARRVAAENSARALGLPALRDARLEQVRGDPLARHIVTENMRVSSFADALRTSDIAALGRLLRESHASLRDDFRVSMPALDELTGALEKAGAIGARLTGAGFGGCVVALIAKDRWAEVSEEAATGYSRATGLEPTVFLCRAADGAGPL